MNSNSRQFKDMQDRLKKMGWDVKEMPPISLNSINNGIWAMLHIQGRNPKDCTCNDCADKHAGYCSGGKTPLECSIKHKDMNGEIFRF